MRGLAGAPRGAAATGGQAGGQGHLEPASADLDDDGLPGRRLLAARPARRRRAATWLSHSVSIHRVCTVNGSRGERLVADDGAVERDDRGHALDDQLVQGAAGALQRLLAGGAGDDQLGQHRVERAGDLAAGLDAGVPAHAGALRDLQARSTGPGAGMKLRPASSALIRNSMLWPRGVGVLGDLQRQAVGDAELLAHQVDAAGLLARPGARPAGGC